MVSWAQRLPDVPTLCCRPGMPFLFLSETCKHKYKAYCFSMIPPSPKHAVLLSHGVNFGGSLCFTGCKLQDMMKIFRGCSWFPTVWHSAGQTWVFHTCSCLDVPCTHHCSSWAGPPHSCTLQGFLARVLCWSPVGATGSDCPLTWAIAEAWWALVRNTKLLSCYLRKCCIMLL